jgi:hypothetical protein
MDPDLNAKRKASESVGEEPKVAIIGASYAGLTLANTLKNHSIGFTVFESSPNYYYENDDANNSKSGVANVIGVDAGISNKRLKPNLFVVGPFILPSLKGILHDLGIGLRTKRSSTHTSGAKDERSSNKSKNNKIDEDSDIDDLPFCYERIDVIEALLYNIQDRIQYNTTITTIIHEKQNNESLFYCSSSCTHTSEHSIDHNKQKQGPFEYIIAADGVHSIIGTNHQMNDDNKILLIGDARWVNDAWYDFGTNRVKNGADIAMNDGIELGLILKNLLNGKEEEECEEIIKDKLCDNSYTTMMIQLKEKYSAKEKCRMRMKRRLIRRIFIILLIAILIQKFRSGTS